MKILVTGAAGFIGSRCAEMLAERGDEVVGIDNINDYYSPELKFYRLRRAGIEADASLRMGHRTVSTKWPNYTFLRLDIEDKGALDMLFDQVKFDKIIHLAAQAGVRYSIENPYAYMHSNWIGFLNILECCRNFNVEHLVYASSSSVYGIACTGLRYFTVYGPAGRPDMAPMLFARAISSGKPIKVFNNGDMMRDFTYIDDIANGTIMVLDKTPDGTGTANGLPYKVYNIGLGSPVSLTDFIAEIETNLGRKAEKILLPMQPGDVSGTWADTTKLETEIGYKPKVALHEGIKNFIEWFKHYENINL